MSLGFGGQSAGIFGDLAGNFMGSLIKPLLPIFLIGGAGLLLFIYVSSHAVARVASAPAVTNLASKVQVIPVPI